MEREADRPRKKRALLSGKKRLRLPPAYPGPRSGKKKISKGKQRIWEHPRCHEKAQERKKYPPQIAQKRIFADLIKGGDELC